MNILAIVAHPDDEVLGMGGTLARFAREGHKVNLLILADGLSARKQCPVNDKIEERWVECDNSCDQLGITPIGLRREPFTDQRLDSYPLLHIIQTIETTIKAAEFIPDMLLTHYLHDLNLDHQLTCRAALTAFRSCPKVLMCRPIPHALPGHPFEPNYWVRLEFVDIAAAIKALDAYESEKQDKPLWRSQFGFENRMATCGADVGAEYAEPFRIVRWME